MTEVVDLEWAADDVGRLMLLKVTDISGLVLLDADLRADISRESIEKAGFPKGEDFYSQYLDEHDVWLQSERMSVRLLLLMLEWMRGADDIVLELTLAGDLLRQTYNHGTGPLTDHDPRELLWSL